MGPGPNPGLEDEEDLGQPGSQQDNRDRSDDFLDEEDDEMAGFIVDEDGGGGGNRRRRSAGLHALPGTNAEALDVTPQALALAPTLSTLSATCSMQLLRCHQLHVDNISALGGCGIPSHGYNIVTLVWCCFCDPSISDQGSTSDACSSWHAC